MALQTSKPITLPSGLVLPNRLVKAAMAEALAIDGLPNSNTNSVYEKWAEGGWGLVITGNVQLDERWLGQPGDNVLIEDETKMIEAWKVWAKACKGAAGGSPTIVQVNHPGRQSRVGAGNRGFFAKALAPSAVPIQLGDGLIATLASAVMFGTPREMTVADIEDVVKRFATTARISAEAGFDGIEIHAAHGFLLAQFLSPKCNLRNDAYGGTPAKGAKIVVDIIQAVREATPKGFTVGLKLNSVDHQVESELRGSIEQLQVIVDTGIDFLEISGGSYEEPLMVVGRKDAEKSDRTRAREAFFIEFAKAVREKFSNVPLILTGGFRTRLGMEAAITEGVCEMIGLGRPAVLNPTLPKNTVFNSEVNDADARLYVKKVPTPWILKFLLPRVGAGAESAWYGIRLREIGKPQ